MTVKAQVKNLYEAVLVIKSSLSEVDIDNNITQLENAIKSYGGNIVKIDEPVRKKFTHKIKSLKDGYYVSILFNASPEVPNILKRTLSISDNILRYIIVRKETK